MAKLRYKYAIRRSMGEGGLFGKKSEERVFFESPEVWDALQAAAPGALALLTEAGFGPMPPGGVDDPDWLPVGRDRYQALQARLRAGLERHDPTPNPGDLFQIEEFLVWVPLCGPEAAKEAVLGVENTGREVGKESRLKWVGLLAASFGAVGAGIYFLLVKPTMEARDQIVSIALDRAWAAGQPTNVEQALEKAGIEGVPVDDPDVERAATALFVAEALRRAQAIQDGTDGEADEESLQRLRESLEALRNR